MDSGKGRECEPRVRQRKRSRRPAARIASPRPRGPLTPARVPGETRWAPRRPSAADTVAWKSTKSDQEFGIDLPDGEPAVSCGLQGNKWVCTAGPFNGDPRTIKYDVTASGTPTLDPDVEVIP